MAAVQLLVAGHYHTLEHLRVRLHVNHHIALHGQVNCLHADIGDLHARLLGHRLVEIELTVDIGHGIHLRAHDSHLRANHRLFVLVHHIASHGVAALAFLHQSDHHDTVVLLDLTANVGHHLRNHLPGYGIGLLHGDTQVFHFVGIVEELDSCLTLHFIEKLLYGGILHHHGNTRFVESLGGHHLGDHQRQDEQQTSFHDSFHHLFI